MTTTPKLQFDMAFITNSVARAAAFTKARAINPAVKGYVGTDAKGDHYFQVPGNPTPVVVKKA